MKIERVILYILAIGISLFFIYPFWWMVMGAMRTTEALMTSPLRLWPEQVRSFIPDPLGPKYQPKTGQLTLSVQITYQDGNMSLFPA